MKTLKTLWYMLTDPDDPSLRVALVFYGLVLILASAALACMTWVIALIVKAVFNV